MGLISNIFGHNQENISSTNSKRHSSNNRSKPTHKINTQKMAPQTSASIVKINSQDLSTTDEPDVVMKDCDDYISESEPNPLISNSNGIVTQVSPISTSSDDVIMKDLSSRQMEHHISSELPEAMLIQEYVDYGPEIPRATTVYKEPTLITTYPDGQDVQLATEENMKLLLKVEHPSSLNMTLDELHEQQVSLQHQQETFNDAFDLSVLQPEQQFDNVSKRLLPPKDVNKFGNKKCLVLDLDETLVHSSFKYVKAADFVIPVEIDGIVHSVYVLKRPGCDEFLRQVAKWYEVVIFTASVSRYGDPLLDTLDGILKPNPVSKNGSKELYNNTGKRHIHQRLFRDSCYNYEGNYVKNLSQIGRPLEDIIILDNSPASYIFHPQHAVPISSWFSDIHDNELLDILPLLKDLSGVVDVGKVLDVGL
ncbi:uncharacterized protein HGUI_04043 [Hanseniaspora guilliermondii]|uniref:Mitochondrial import inner membrane translocase subunit TIM50 n=1 Tax=Hanseniaspora guilliermondii TaxID=56406 RepID=A0A1L0B617_9ASCO|nr:uncharacterized protein HGUI_04043 [Hanseniaspora guilliermondii]